MAELTAPEVVIRIKRQEFPTANWGYKWHFVKSSSRRKTACRMLIPTSSYKWEVSKLAEVKAKDICADFCS